MAYEVVGVGDGGAATVCGLLDSLCFRYSLRRPEVAPPIFVGSPGGDKALLANPLCSAAEAPATVAAEPELVCVPAPAPALDRAADGAAEAFAARLAYTFAMLDRHGYEA